MPLDVGAANITGRALGAMAADQKPSRREKSRPSATPSSPPAASPRSACICCYTAASQKNESILLRFLEQHFFYTLQFTLIYVFALLFFFISHLFNVGDKAVIVT